MIVQGWRRFCFYVGMMGFGLLLVACGTQAPKTVLVFSKTNGYRHQSIADGIQMMQRLADQRGFEVVFSEDAAYFHEDSLRQFSAVMFLNTTQDILDHYQQADFERYIQAGGGFVGVHAATDTEYHWPWYNQLVGAYFDSHPPGTHEAAVRIVRKHPSTDSLPETWMKTDEWYNFKSINPDVTVLAWLDESTYQGGTNGDKHPAAWYHEYDGGRAFYTALGHTKESYTDPLFVNHVWGGLSWVMEGDKGLDYSLAKSQRVPEENRFTIEVLKQGLYEPTEMVVLDDHRVLYCQRRGQVMLYDPRMKTTSVAFEIPVYTEKEDGLMGMALDPAFDSNQWIYLYYANPSDEPVHYLSRFKFANNRFDMASEQRILEVPVQRQECCHTGGSIEFDSNGLLYLSTGDDTNPFSSNGFGPIDERPGRKPWDGQRTSGNANDLRGAILRIKVNEDGSYDIPDGNLFAKGTAGTRPEIYVMGNRNPYRISLDAKRGTLYWGEVGPDAGEDGQNRGPKGHDEVNQAKTAGFFGWPYFVGDNKAYHDYDFATEQSGAPFDPAKPMNTSVNNTGIQELPPAQPAFIWYPYGPSKEFPLAGQGGRNAMAGPVYYQDMFEDSDVRFPDYFNEKLFIYDWMRGWVHLVTMDEEENFVKMEPFLPSQKFRNPMDMQFAKDGSLYLIEYGTNWFKENDNARLLRITYNGSNRPPVVAAAVDQMAGAAPHSVTFSAEGTMDYDGDELSYQWDFDGTSSSSSRNPTFEYQNPGVYYPTLTVRDSEGNEAQQQLRVVVGNAPPVIDVAIEGNRSFYWDVTDLNYAVAVTDAEDGTLGQGIDEGDIVVTAQYLQLGFDMTEVAQGHQTAGDFLDGKAIMDESDCMACHALNEESIGPTYLQVAERYQDDTDAVSYLANKIINGGGGVWGEQAMAAHPQLEQGEAEKIAQYILSLSDEEEGSLPVQGTVTLADHQEDKDPGSYFIQVSYQDKGSGDVEALEAFKSHEIRYYRFGSDRFERAGTTLDMTAVQGLRNFDEIKNGIVGYGTVLKLGQLDLTGVGSIALAGFCAEQTTDVSIAVFSNGEQVGLGSLSSTGEGAGRGLTKAAGMISFTTTVGLGELELRVSEGNGDKPLAMLSEVAFNRVSVQ
ncbi:MAG: ThuA domain-containing protein [Bacteroidota bacterium]